ncbi:MAG: penicillin-binding protein 2 [Porticoccus sp.]|jgi:penicillin-binding protein 2
MASPAAIKDPHKEKAIFFNRLMIIVLLLLAAFSGLAYRYYNLQITNYQSYQTQSERNRVQLRPVPPVRGLIFDRNGILLAENRPSYQLAIVRERVDDLATTLAQLKDLLGLSDEQIEGFHKNSKGRRPFQSIALKLQLNEEDIALMAVNRHKFAGVEVEALAKRFYPKGELFAHVSGYVGRINPAEAARIDKQSYAGTNYIGKSGLEKYYEDILHGEVGYENVETNARGRVLRVLDRVEPKPGSDLILNLDSRVQEAAANALAGQRGAVVAIDPKTGGIIALVSTPSFDPNLFVNGISNTDYDSLNKSLDLPLFNRALQGQYPPGSTIKPIVGLAGLEYNLMAPSTIVKDPGWFQLPNDERRFRDWKKRGHGNKVDLHLAIEQSCDVYFYHLANKMGIDRMHDFSAKFGLGAGTGIDLFNEKTGILPSSKWKRRTKNQVWFPGETLNVGIGQGYMLTTPLQLAVAAAAIASKGLKHTPQILKSVSGEVPIKREGERFNLVKESHWDLIFDAMEAVVHAPRGTAHSKSRNMQYKAAGKTGTSQVIGIAQDEEYDITKINKRNWDHGLYIGFAPLEDPVIAVAVIVENGDGSSAAVPIARKVTDAYILGQDGKPKAKYNRVASAQ